MMRIALLYSAWRSLDECECGKILDAAQVLRQGGHEVFHTAQGREVLATLSEWDKVVVLPDPNGGVRGEIGAVINAILSHVVNGRPLVVLGTSGKTVSRLIQGGGGLWLIEKDVV